MIGVILLNLIVVVIGLVVVALVVEIIRDVLVHLGIEDERPRLVDRPPPRGMLRPMCPKCGRVRRDRQGRPVLLTRKQWGHCCDS